MARKIEVQIVGDPSSVDRMFRSASNSAQGFGSRMASVMGVAARAAAAGTAVMGLGLGYVVKQAAAFQDELNTFQAVTRASGKQMKDVSAISKQLGADITLPATSAADAAAAMTELAKAGLSVKQSMAAAKGVLQLSAAAEISNADAAQIVANNLNAFHLAGDKATHVADLLAASSIAASGSMTDMSESLTMTAATAAQAHIPIEDVVAAIGEMANRGIIGSQSGAALQQMLLKLEKPTRAGADAMKQLGISVYDAQGHMVSMPSLIEQFTKATAGMSDKQRNAAMNTIFGSRAIRAANIVLLGGIPAYDKMRKAVDRQGAAADVAKAKMRGFHGSLQALQSAVETLAIDLGTPLLGPLAAAATAVANFVNSIDTANIGQSLWEKVFGNAGSTIASHNTSGAGLDRGLASMIGNAVASVDWDAVWGRARGIGAGLEHRFESIDWTAVGAAIGNGISDAVDKAISGTKGLPSAFENAFHSINWNDLGRAAGPGLAAAVVSAIAAITDPAFWFKNWDLVLAIALTVFSDGIGRIAGKFAEPLVRLMGDGLLKMLVPIERFSPRLAEALLHDILGMQSIVARGFAPLTAMVEKAFNKLGAVSRFVIKVLGAQAAIDTVVNLAKRIYDELKKLVAAIPGAMGDMSHLLYNAGVNLIMGLVHGIESKFDVVKKMLHKLTSMLPSWKGPPSTDAVILYGAGQVVISGFVAGLESKYKDVQKSLQGFGSSLAIDGAIRAAARSIGLAQAESVAQGFLAGTPTMAQQIKQGLADAVAKARQAVTDSKANFVSAFADLANSALQAFDDKVAAWVPPAMRVLDKMQLEDEINNVKQAVSDAQAQLAQATTDANGAAFALMSAETNGPNAGESDADYQARLAQLQANYDQAKAQVVAAQKAVGDAERQQTELNEQLLAQKQQAAHDKRMAKQREQLAKELLQTQQWLAKHPAEWDKMNAKILAILKKFDIPMFKAGQKFASQFADGMKDGLAGVAKAAHAWANAIDQYVPHSPAKTGPLSYSSYDAGLRFASQFGDGLGDGFYRGQGMRALALSAAGGMSGGGGGGGSRGQVNIELSLPNYLGDRYEVIGWLRDEFTRIGKRDGSVFGGYA